MLKTSTDSQEDAPASSLLVAIGIVMIVSARFAWLYSHAEIDTPPPALALCLFELPFVFCLLPFVTTDEISKRSGRSAGIVFGTTLSFCLVSPPLWFDAQFTAWGNRNGYPAALAGWLPVCFILAVWILGFSWRYRKRDRDEFTASAKEGILGSLFVALLVLLASFWGRI